MPYQWSEQARITHSAFSACKSLGVDHTGNLADVLDHCSSDAREACCLQLEDQVIIAEQQGCIGDRVDLLSCGVDLELRSVAYIDENITDCHANH